MKDGIARMPTVERHPPLVYFAEALLTGLVKIGFTTRINARMKMLEDDYDTINLLATTEGGKAREREIHGIFNGVRIKDEWFAPSPLLLEYIAANCTRHNAYLPADESLSSDGFHLINGNKYYLIRDVVQLTGERRDLLAQLLHEYCIPIAMEGKPILFDEYSFYLLLNAIDEYRTHVPDEHADAMMKKVRIHEKLHEVVKTEAIRRRMTVSQFIHETLCRRLERPDLMP
jgi:hypothetical protein